MGKLPENNAAPGRKADALVDGVRTEFKRANPPKGKVTTSDSVRNAINDSLRGKVQARQIIYDARDSGLTREEAERALRRIAGITRGKLDSVRIIGDGFDLTGTYPQ
jgi:hypothetical protein